MENKKIESRARTSGSRDFAKFNAIWIVLPFEMFDNIFVGSSAVFPNRPGPVEHKTKGVTTRQNGKRKPRPKRREPRETKGETAIRAAEEIE